MWELIQANYKPYLIAAFAVAIFAAGWTVNGWRLEAQIKAKDTVYAETLAKATQAAKDAQEAMAGEIAAIDRKRTKEVSDARKEIDRLRASVAAGTARLRVNARCGAGMPQGATGPGVDYAGSPELTGEAERDYFALREGIETVTAQLRGCQDIIRAGRD